MKLIKPYFQILEQGVTKQDIYKHIEKCARTCYKSEDLITDESAVPFVERMINRKHLATLEHGTVYLTVSVHNDYYVEVIDSYRLNKYSEIRYDDNNAYITTNLRVILENNWQEDLQYLSEPTDFHAKRVTVKFVCNRQVSHEYVRHRVFSFCQESTRYCNYTKGKFGGELIFIQPLWTYDKTDKDFDYDEACRELADTLGMIEGTYFYLIEDCNWKPQQAATILPNALKTELVMTGFIEDWKHFFDLRALEVTGPAHPQAKELTLPLYEEFVKRGYIK